MAGSPLPFVVRDASESDGARLAGLMAGSVAAGGVRWSIEPGQDPFAALRAERGGWTVALAEDPGGSVLGFVSVASRMVLASGRRLRSCYVTNLKVLPEHRGRGIGDALCWHAVALCRRVGGESVPILMLIGADNALMRRRAAGPRGLPKLAKLATVNVHSIDARRAAAIPADHRIDVRRANPGDLEEMAMLWTAVASERRFSPAFDAAELRSWIEGAPGLALADYLVARSGGRIVGWMGWWDEVAVRVVRIAGYTPTGAIRRGIQDAAALVMGGRRPAKAGARIGCVRAVHTCVPGARPDVLRALVAEGARNCSHDSSWLKIALDAQDPLGRALLGLRARVTAFDARLSSPSGGDAQPPDDARPLHLDAALI